MYLYRNPRNFFCTVKRLVGSLQREGNRSPESHQKERHQQSQPGGAQLEQTAMPAFSEISFSTQQTQKYNELCLQSSSNIHQQKTEQHDRTRQNVVRNTQLQNHPKIKHEMANFEVFATV